MGVSRAFVLTILLAIACAHVPRPARAFNADDEEAARYLISGWQAEREKLQFGRFELTNDVQVIERPGRPFAEYETNDRITVDFDHVAGQVAQRCYRGAGLSLYLLRTADACARYTSDSHVVQVLRPDHQEAPLPLLYEIDVRTIGYASFSNLEGAMPFREAVESMKLFLVRPSVEELGDGRQRITVERPLPGKGNPSGVFRASAVINERRGFSLEEHRVDMVPRNDEAAAQGAALFMVISTEWDQRNGVWIPVSTTFDEPMAFIRGRVRLDWKLVNEQPAAECFDLDRSELSDATIVSDDRLSKERPLVTTLKARRTAEMLVAEAADPAISPKTRWLLILNIIVVLALATAAVTRRLRGTRAKLAGGHGS